MMLKPFASFVVLIILVLGSVRGMVVLALGVHSQTIYNLTASLIIILSLYGYHKRQVFDNPRLKCLKNLFYINLFLGLAYAALECLLGSGFESSVVYLFLLPFSLFLFMLVPTPYLKMAITVITVLIAYSVLDNFVESLQGAEGYHNLIDYNEKLRPDTFEALSRTGKYFRASGYTGNYHDSANILGMTGVYFFTSYLITGKWLNLGLSLLAISSILLTQSATNILVLIATCLVVSAYVLVCRWNSKTLFLLLTIIALIAFIFTNYADYLLIFTERIDSDADWDGMTRHLNLSAFFKAMPFFIAGHASAFGSQIVEVESALLKGVFQLGIVHASIFYLILIYPIVLFLKNRTSCFAALPAVAAIFFGFMSLLHYGSLFRVTSIALFYAIYAICLISIARSQDSKELRRDKSGIN
jgi:hypothetical protein